MDGGALVAEFLKARGVDFLYTLCGGHISPILVGCKQRGIRVIDVRHEANAVFAADATARLTGKPGVAAVTAGPGVTNTITAVKNAQLAQSPLILNGGAAPSLLKGRGALQDIDQLSLFKPHVKWMRTVKRVNDIVPTLENAWYISQQGAPGPVFVEMPLDVLFPQSVVRDWFGAKAQERGAKTMVEKATQWYLRRHVNKVFQGISDDSNPADAIGEPIPFKVKRISESKINRVARELSKAKKPVMLIGSQATLAPSGMKALVRAVESLRVPVWLSGMARGLLGKDHELHLRHKRKLALREADLVILCGAVCDFRLDYGNHISKKAFYANVNREKAAVTLNKQPPVAMVGDPAYFVQALAGSMEHHPRDPATESWLAALKERDSARNGEIEAQATQTTDGLNPVKLCQDIEDCLRDESIIVADGGDFVATASYITQPRGPLCWLDPGPFGTLGVGGGFALGAALCRPKSDVWIIYGDGSSAYTLAEWDTFTRHQIGLVAVVGNDASWRQIARDQITILKDAVGTELRYTDYHQVAQGFGGEGFLLKDPSETDQVLETSLSMARRGRPVLINAIIGKTEFRKGSISM